MGLVPSVGKELAPPPPIPLGIAVGREPPPKPPVGMPAHCDVLLFEFDVPEEVEELEQAASTPTPASAAIAAPANRTVNAFPRRSLIPHLTVGCRT